LRGKTAGAGARHFEFQHPLPSGQAPAIEAVGLIGSLLVPLVRMGVDKPLPFFQEHGFQKTLMIFFHLLFEVIEKEPFCSLQALPTGGRLNDEDAVRSHGCIAFHKVCGFDFHTKPRYTRSHRFYTTTLTPPAHRANARFY
jgi:hypothetical protein